MRRLDAPGGRNATISPKKEEGETDLGDDGAAEHGKGRGKGKRTRGGKNKQWEPKKPGAPAQPLLLEV